MRIQMFETVDSRIGRCMDSAEGNRVPLDGSRTARDIVYDVLSVLAGIAILLAGWWIVGCVYNTYMATSMTFPMPDEVIADLLALISGKRIFTFTLWDHIVASIERWLIGFMLAVLVGMALGLLISANQTLYRILMVPINALQMIPGLAWLPVVMILFGFGSTSAIFMVGIVAVAPIAINVSNGLRNVPKVNRRVADMSGISAWDRFLEVTLPFAALDVVSGLRTGMGNSWRMIIAAEMVVGVMTGIGFAIKGATDTLDYTTAFACIIVICIIGLLIDKLVFDRIERYVRKLTGVGDE
ncbi:MAG: ABC transporter permease [Candidatus Methanomethylophilaceae archaeon]